MISSGSWHNMRGMMRTARSPFLKSHQAVVPAATVPKTVRANLLKYDPYKQINSRLQAFKLMNHPTQKIELIIMGGNFLEYPIQDIWKTKKISSLCCLGWGGNLIGYRMQRWSHVNVLSRYGETGRH